MSMRRAKVQIVLLLLIALAVSDVIPSPLAQSGKLGLLRIIKAEYPVQVPLSYSFSIRLKIEYALRDYFEIYAAVYEGPRETFADRLWEGEHERLIEVGEKTYNIQLKSPPTETQWVLTAYIFTRNASRPFYFTDQERGPGFAEMRIKVADNAKLTLRTKYGKIPVSIDGTAYYTAANGILVRELKVLTEHTISAPSNVSITEGWRAVFRGWNGSDSANPKILLVTRDLILTVDFRDEFYLDVVSSVDNVRGAGWYPSGAIANFSASSLVPSKNWQGIIGAQWRFIGWTGDVESAAPNELIVMDRPHRVVASWATDYEPTLYLAITLAVAVAVVLAVFVRRRITGERAGQPVGPAVREFCMFCGADIDPDAKFCSKCGKGQVS